MPPSLLLLISLSAFAIEVLLFVRRPPLRQTLLRRRPLLLVLVSSVLLSVASALVRTSGASGTGTRTSYGFPKPFYFTWESWEHPVSHAGLYWLYFAGNTVGWFALLSLVALLWAALRRRSSAAAPA